TMRHGMLRHCTIGVFALSACASSETGDAPPPPAGPEFGADAGPIASGCSNDGHRIVASNGDTVETCEGATACHPGSLRCEDACAVAVETKGSVGCEYYGVSLSAAADTDCFAVFVANTWDVPAHFTVNHGAETIDVSKFARLPHGKGKDVAYDP